VRGGEHGVDGVYRAIEQLAGLPLPASAVETLILPARVHDYAPAMMDELTTAGEVIWCGAGATSGGDGWLVLAPSDAPELLPPPTLADGDAARAVIDLLRGTGGWFYGPLADRLNADLGISRDDLAAVLTELLWAGWLTNDTLGPVRSGLTPTPARRPRVDRTPPRRRAGRYPRPARGAAARIPGRLGGRWSLVVRGDVDETRRAAVAGTWLLDRHAVVTRGVAAAERFPGGFSALYRVLRAVEDSGGCIRSYAIEGLGAAQFTTAAVVDQLRDRADAAARAAESGETATPVLLAATDPAQPFGAALRWPERPAAGGDSAGHRPGRKAGAAVVISDDGLLLAYLERGGRTLLTWTDDPSTLASCARVLAEGVREGRLPTLTITRRNGADIVADPAVDAFTEAGFRLTPRGLRLRAV
jgi:ATP-dependent Lhr-like helicase